MPRKNSPQTTVTRSDTQHALETAQQLLQTGQVEKALSHCRSYLRNSPDNVDILNFAGIIAAQDKQYIKAEKYFRRAIQAAPDKVLLYCNLANTLQNSGNIDGAIAACNSALKRAPNHQDVLLTLGQLYLRTGNDSAAIKLFQRLLGINPKNIAALQALEKYYKNILKNAPDNFAAILNLANILKLGRRYEEAGEYFLRANRIDPDNRDVLINLAHIYHLLDRPADAEPIYRKVIKLTPDDPSLHSNLGVALNNLGKVSDAIESFRTAIRIEPTYAQAHKLLSFCKKHREYDDDIRAMENTLQLTTLNTEQRYYLNFGLGKAYEDLQKYDRAFSYYRTANDLARSLKHYNINDDIRRFNDIRNAFTKERFLRFENCGHTSKRPIFILGMPRSGTTLVEQILSSHPDVHGGGELKLLDQVIRGYFLHHFNCQFPKGMEQIVCDQFAELGRQYCDMLSRYDATANYVTNKMPSSFLFVGMIRLILPDATIIHCRRNPLDTCFSCYANGFRDGHEFTYDLEELGRYYCLYENLMQHWRQFPDIHIFDCDYESLVSDQEGQTRRLLDACGLEWNDACLDFHKSDRTVMTASVNQVRNGLYTHSVQRWRHFQTHLTPLIDILRNGLVDTSALP